MADIKVVTLPSAPDRHGDLRDVGTLTHDQVDRAIADLVDQVRELQEELTTLKNTPPGRVVFRDLPDGTLELDLEPHGLSYIPGTNSVLVWGNSVKQRVGENYLEVSPTRLRLTAPAAPDDEIEVYVLPVPFTAVPGL